MRTDTTPRNDETIDGLFRGKIKVIQARKGYRVSEDALILTWFVNAKPGELILDAGTGSGVIAFGLAAAHPTVKVIALEIQESLADRAARGVRLNNLGSRVSVVRGDVRHADRFFRPSKFHRVVSNPPFHGKGQGHVSSREEKALARHQLIMPLPDLFEASKRLLIPHGKLCFIYPAANAVAVQRSLKEAGFKPSSMLWIYTHEGARPHLMCVEANMVPDVGPLIEDRLILYDETSSRTREAEAILNGEWIRAEKSPGRV
ncbi:MAG: methyltransferase [Thermodesulfobacteriota bacterium]